jgi:hypothetical protein
MANAITAIQMKMSIRTLRFAGSRKSLRAITRAASANPLPISEKKESNGYFSIWRLENQPTTARPAVPRKPTNALGQSRKYWVVNARNRETAKKPASKADATQKIGYTAKSFVDFLVPRDASSLLEDGI